MEAPLRVMSILGICALGIILSAFPELLPAVTNWFSNPQSCVFGLTNGQCESSKTSEIGNLSLGDALAALGLLLVIYQLSTSRWKIALAVRKRQTMIGIYLTAAGLVCAATAVIISQTSLNLRLIGYPAFWELLSYIFLVSAPLTILLSATTFTDRLFKSDELTARRFYNEIARAYSTGNDKDLEAAIYLVARNAKRLAEAAKKARYVPHGLELEEEHNQISDLIALEIINLTLSEKPCAELLATKRVDFMVAILGEMEAVHLSGQAVGASFDRLAQELFDNKESHLYRQLNYLGLTRYFPVYDFLFGHFEVKHKQYFVEELQILRAWNTWRLDRTETYKPDYFKVFEKAMITALKTNGLTDHYRNQGISLPLKELPEYYRELVIESNKSSSGEYGDIENLLSNLTMFFYIDLPKIISDITLNGSMSDFEREVRGRDEWELSITGTYAFAMAEMFKWTSYLLDEEHMRLQALHLSGPFVKDYSYSGMEKIREKFSEYVWTKIVDNVESGFYPATVKSYILMFIYKRDNVDWYVEERKKLFKYLDDKLVPRINSKSKKRFMNNGNDLMSDALLPKKIRYSARAKAFYWTDNGGQESKIYY